MFRESDVRPSYQEFRVLEKFVQQLLVIRQKLLRQRFLWLLTSMKTFINSFCLSIHVWYLMKMD